MAIIPSSIDHVNSKLVHVIYNVRLTTQRMALKVISLLRFKLQTVQLQLVLVLLIIFHLLYITTQHWLLPKRSNRAHLVSYKSKVNS